ncbi:zinc finger Ran-binding domain-containing protein [Kitasatospora sp. NPDC056327]|uniref:zinc finger Ran-binding domain-containing protein n=1 Tax=Kitasatospora sp. NPDC056327 TaxID=3345785 RepID=UPI0035DE7CEB
MSTFAVWTCAACGTGNPAVTHCTRCGAARPAAGADRPPHPKSPTVPVVPAAPSAPPAPTFAPPAPRPAGPAPARAPIPGRASWTPHPPGSPLATDATRYLCTAVQLDGELAGKLIESVLEEPHRAVASSPGVDLVCVLRHALDARTRQTVVKAVLALISIALLASLGAPVLLLPLLLLAWAVILVERLTVFYGVLRPKLSRTAFDPAQAPAVNRARDAARLRLVADQDHRGNVTVHSGYEPFLGYGNLFDSWNFAVPVDRPADHHDDVLPFGLGELADQVSGAVASLGLPGVHVSERVFVNGADLAQDLDPALRALLLPLPEGRPVVSLPPHAVERLREDGSGRARPYLVATVSGWAADLVSTTAVRFSLSPAKDVLFVEGTALLLPPVDRRYHLVDHLLDRPTWRQLAALTAGSLAVTPGRLARSLLALVTAPRRLLDGFFKEQDQRRQIARSAFNYGARTSIRQLASDSHFQRYYQQIDRQMYSKIIERRTLDTLIDFLQDHRVDVSELRERQNIIYNGGIFASGNSRIDFVNSPVAAGAGSRIRTMVGRGPAEQRRER